MNDLKFRPTGTRILIEPLPPPSKTDTGLFVPESAGQDANQEGIVRCLGAGRTTKYGEPIPFDMAVGDRVLVRSFSGQPLKIDGKLYKLFHADEVMAILE